jgi:heterodisulfide reductase subunit C
MKNYFIKMEDFSDFVDNLIKNFPVIGPVAKRTRFVFSDIENVDQLRLDYDTTILPPKKVFFPTKQTLLEFDGDDIKGCIDPKEKILLGVHPYDIKAISMLDYLFNENHSDNNYLANRNATTIIGSNVQNHYKFAFFGTQATEMEVKGHDMFITKINGGYQAQVLTDKGEKLLKHGKFSDANDNQVKEAEEVNKKANENCPEKLNNSAKEIRDKVRSNFGSKELWNELSELCFSCGTCNTVCPTCYCFDVQDLWNIDQKSGCRYRRWDGCLAYDFSEVSVQGGTENFREHRSDRFRHRVMRKLAYLNDRLGTPACVGCGRCSGGCTIDIANPVKIVNKVMEG